MTPEQNAAYREYEADRSRLSAMYAVDRKLAEGSIHIGKPPLKDGETLNVIDDGTRYEITEAC